MTRLTEKAFEQDVEIIAAVNGARSPVHVTIDPDKIQVSANNRKPVLPGVFFSGANDAARPLPRTKAASNVTEAATTVITVDEASYLVDGDVLRVLAPMAQVQFSGTWATGDTFTLTIGGINYEHTLVANAGLAVATVAAEVAAALADDPSMANMVDAIAALGSIYIIAKDFATPYSIAEAVVTAGNGDAAIQGGLANLKPNQVIGTIDTSGVDDAQNQVTLSGTASIDVGIGVPVGVVSKPLGMITRGFDGTYDPPEQGLYTSVSVYADRMPYWDGELARLFPEITQV